MSFLNILTIVAITNNAEHPNVRHTNTSARRRLLMYAPNPTGIAGRDNVGPRGHPQFDDRSAYLRIAYLAPSVAQTV